MAQNLLGQTKVFLKHLGRMTTILIFAIFGTAMPLGIPKAASAYTPGVGAPTAAYRWWQDNDKDWVTIPAHGTQYSDSKLASLGYTKNATPQYYVNLIGTNDPDMVAVYRWWNPTDKDWVDITDGSISDSTLTSLGYNQKTFQYYAYRSAASGRVAVNRWWNPTDKDWVTLHQDEISDANLTSWGYTQKTFLVYAYAVQSPTNEIGYFTLGTPQSAVVPTSMAADNHPHTMSVVDVNPSLDPSINNGYRYLGYFGHENCGGIYMARTNDLNAATWQQDTTPPTFTGITPCRWANALVDGQNVDLVVNQVWNADNVITAQVSTDGLNGTSFGTPITLVYEQYVNNGNPTLFRDPTTNRFYLYWYRHIWGQNYEIRVRSSDTFAGLAGSGPGDLGQLVATSPEVVAAPQVMYVNGKYYLATETHEGEDAKTQEQCDAGLGCAQCLSGSNCVWKTRMLVSTSPTGPFYEIPGNPIYPAGAACVFQHVVGNTLHSYYCQQNTPGDLSSWTLDHVVGNLLSPN